MHLKSCDEVIKIYKRAKIIRDRTPYSFRILTYNLEIFLPNSKNLKNSFSKFSVENLLAIPIYPSEIFSIAYSNIVDCPDEHCFNFQKKILDNKRELHLIGETDCQKFVNDNKDLSKYCFTK